jgi:hypothetical protein
MDSEVKLPALLKLPLKTRNLVIKAAIKQKKFIKLAQGKLDWTINSDNSVTFSEAK